MLCDVIASFSLISCIAMPISGRMWENAYNKVHTRLPSFVDETCQSQCLSNA